MNKIIPYLAEIIGAFMFVFLSIPIKTVKLPPIYKSFITVLVLFICSFLYIKFKNYREKRENKMNKVLDLEDVMKNKNSIIISLVYTLFTVGTVVAFEMLPISIALPVLMSAVIFTIVFNSYLNNVEPTKFELISVPIIILGILMVVYKKQKFEKKYIVGIVFGLLAAIGISYVFAAIKKQLPKNINNAVFKTNIELFEYSYITTLVLFVGVVLYSLYYKYVPDMKQVVKMIVYIFIFQYIGYQFYYYAYNVLETNEFVIISNIEIPFSLLLGYFVFNENISIKKLVGSFMILGGVMLGLVK